MLLFRDVHLVMVGRICGECIYIQNTIMMHWSIKSFQYRTRLCFIYTDSTPEQCLRPLTPNPVTKVSELLDPAENP